MPVPRLSFFTIDFHARKTLQKWQPDALERPEPIDLRNFWPFGFEMLGADCTVRSVDEMGDAEAWTEWPRDGRPIVSLREDMHNALLGDEESQLRARSDVAHETGHVVLHTKIVEEDTRWALSADEGERAATGCEEWQAWAFAGCLLMPCEVVLGLDRLDPLFLTDLFVVSPQMARCHLFRMRQAGML